MKDIPVLYCKLKKYERTSKTKSEDGSRLVTRRYMIPVKKEQIEGSNFEDIEDIVILSEADFNQELQGSQDINKLRQSISKKDQEIINLEILLNDKNQEVAQFKNILEEKDQKIGDLKDLHEIQVGELQSKLNMIDAEYQAEIKGFNAKINEFNDLISQHENLKAVNAELEREIKRLSDLRTLEKESFRIKLNELELTHDEYDKLKKSHELLWNVVQEKDKLIKNMEKKGVVDNILKKIRKKEGT